MNHKSSEKGAVLILVALGMIVFLGLAALVIDVGYLYLTKNQLHVAADGAALAGATQIVSSTDCTPTAVRNKAQEFAAFHKAGSKDGQTDVIVPDGDIVLGNFTSPTFTPCPTTPVNAVKVTTRRTSAGGNPPAVFFGNIFGNPISNVTAFATAIGGVRGDIPVCISDCAFNSGCPITGITLQPDSAETAVWTSFFEADGYTGYAGTEFYINNPGSAPCITDEGKKIHLKNGGAGLLRDLDSAINEEASSVPVVLPVCDATCNTNTPNKPLNYCTAPGYGSGPGSFLPVIGSVVFTISKDIGGATATGIKPQGNIKGIYGSFTGSVSPVANCSGLVE